LFSGELPREHSCLGDVDLGLPSMNPKWERVGTVALIVCALVTTALVVRHEFFAPQERGKQDPQSAMLIEAWRSQLAKGETLGPPDARINLIEFADFECPFCASFHKTLKDLRDHYPNQVSLTYVHFPLPMHRFAIPAARVAECAREQGRFEAMHDRLFEGQDALGLKPWTDYAAEAGVPDLAAFTACTKRTEPIPRVEAGKALAKELDINATPTLIVNGWMLSHPPSPEELDAMIKAVLAGKNPVPDGHKS
jgi:protein-disulfide isomerase